MVLTLNMSLEVMSRGDGKSSECVFPGKVIKSGEWSQMICKGVFLLVRESQWTWGTRFSDS